MSGASGYADFVRRQQDALLREFFDDPGHCFIGIPDLAAFRKRHFGRGGIRSLPNTSPSEAVIYARGPGTEELWVKPFDKGVTRSDAYRDHWAAFVAAMGAGPVTYTLNGRAQVVDHLLPETFATRQGYSHVRVIMVDYRGNAVVGSVVEKSMANRASPGKSMLADWFTAAKASCFGGSFAAAVNAATVMAALRAHIAARGFALPSAQDAATATGMEAILAWVRAG